MNKKTLIASIALALSLLLLCSCGKTNDDGKQEEQIKTPEFTSETLPRLDGSTATIPLSEGIVKALLKYAASDAQDFVNHNTTHNAYVNLIDGQCDLIFVTPPSEEEEELMENSSNNYTVDMVVKDAFVFLVNAENNVEDISLADLRKIYTGEITNWSELGGADLEIIAYQRPDNSGSQTLMYKHVVDKETIMDAPSELKPQGMGDLVDVISDYDEGAAAIGYSVYYYASGMYTNVNSKLIAVDGVYPTIETISNGTYPLSDGYYAVYDSSLTEESEVMQLIGWLKSDDGQAVAASEGYAPLRPLSN